MEVENIFILSISLSFLFAALLSYFSQEKKVTNPIDKKARNSTDKFIPEDKLK